MSTRCPHCVRIQPVGQYHPSLDLRSFSVEVQKWEDQVRQADRVARLRAPEVATTPAKWRQLTLRAFRVYRAAVILGQEADKENAELSVTKEYVEDVHEAMEFLRVAFT